MNVDGTNNGVYVMSYSPVGTNKVVATVQATEAKLERVVIIMIRSGISGTFHVNAEIVHTLSDLDFLSQFTTLVNETK